MEVITIKPHRYRNEQKQVGDKYIIHKNFLRLYKALGWVAVLPKELKPLPFIGTNEEAKKFSNPNFEFKNPLIKTEGKKTPKGKYKRKDLKAE